MKNRVRLFILSILCFAFLENGVFAATRMGLDYAFPPRPTAAEVKSAGYSFVVRYVGGSSTKQITLTEANELKAAGVDLILVFESTANRMLSGQSAGVTDANTAISQANAAGAPANFFCYFACDFDAQLADQTAINAYLDGVASVFGGTARIGFYGGYFSLKRTLDAGKAVKGWQTTAWSGGLKDARISLFQTGGTVVIDGATCDVDEGYADDLGQWSIPRSALQVFLEPSGALAAGAQWRVNGGAWQDSGTILRGLTTNNHTLTFKAVTGWTTPAAMSVAFSPYATTSVTVPYTQTGSLFVSFGPAGAVQGGGAWNVDGGPWNANGASLTAVQAGNHILSFKPVEGWASPPDQTVTINLNETTSATGTYSEVVPVALNQSRLSDGVFQFKLQGPVGNSYRIESSSDFVNWNAMTTNAIPAGGTILIIQPISGEAEKVYRAVRVE